LKEETEKIERGCHEIKNQNQELKDKLELMEELLKKLELENLQVEKLENKIQA
jgi:hypothetical protein